MSLQLVWDLVSIQVGMSSYAYIIMYKRFFCTTKLRFKERYVEIIKPQNIITTPKTFLSVIKEGPSSKWCACLDVLITNIFERCSRWNNLLSRRFIHVSKTIVGRGILFWFSEKERCGVIIRKKWNYMWPWCQCCSVFIVLKSLHSNIYFVHLYAINYLGVM